MLDTMDTLITSMNTISSSVNSSVKSLANPSANLLSQVDTLMDQIDVFYDLLNEAETAGSIAKVMTEKGDSMDTKPVAKITLAKAPAEGSALYDATFLPDTNRETYRNEPLSSAQTIELESLSSANGCSIKLYQDQDNLSKISGYAMYLKWRST